MGDVAFLREGVGGIGWWEYAYRRMVGISCHDLMYTTAVCTIAENL